MGGHQLLQAWLLNDLGCVYDVHGDHDSAIRVQQQAIVIKERVLGRDHPDVGLSETNIALSLSSGGRHEEALTHVNRSVEVVEKGLGAGHPDVATQLSNRGEILSALHRYQEARASFERARTIMERELSPENLNIAYPLTGIGMAYLSERNPGNALVPLERALRIRQQQELDIGKRAETRFALARALWDSSRDRGRARALAEQARAEYSSHGEEAKVAEIDRWLLSHAAIAQALVRRRSYP
jgi:tetratricopeptide (TPR) repeat protein